MAEEAETRGNNKLIAIIAGVVLAVAAVVIAIVIINNNKGEVLSDDFFKTDSSKIVISNSSDSTDATVAKKVHQVYFVDGDKITGLKIYSEFESEQAAKDADAKPEVAEAMKTGMYKDHKVQGKFIIVTMAESTYQDVTAEQLRTAAELVEKAVQEGAKQQSESTDESSVKETEKEAEEESEE